MEIKKVAILGAGAVGAYLIEGLTEKLQDNLIIIAEGKRKARYETEGIIINEKTYFPHVLTPEETGNEKVDLLIVSCKSAALVPSIPDIKKAVSENTLVLSLMNGVESEEIISEAVGNEHVMYSLIKISSRRADGKITFDMKNTMGVWFGELDGKPSERTDALFKLAEGTELHFHLSETILLDVWAKFGINVSRNLVQAVLSVGQGAYADSEHVHYMAEKLLYEVALVAEKKGVRLIDNLDKARLLFDVPKKDRYSTLQDIDAKRHTEIDMFSGAVVSLGQKYGVPTPYNDFMLHMIHAMEEKNDGLFDYE